MEFSDFHNAIEAREPRPTGARGWIQWKGTDACIGIDCECGHHAHLDEEFLYHYRCPACGAAYALSPHIRLVRLTAEEEAFVDGGGAIGFKGDEPEEPGR